jgi:coenzyme PQQ synthesis protein D (PqqD)
VSAEPFTDSEVRPRRVQHVIAREGDREVLLLDVESGCYYTLNEIGGRIWELCDGASTVSEIAAALSAEYDASPETIGVDVLELIQDLRREHLLEG